MCLLYGFNHAEASRQGCATATVLLLHEGKWTAIIDPLGF